jgi:hypothetical protein
VDASRAEGVQVGDHNVQHNYFGRRREVAWPCRVGVVPPPAVGRQSRPADHDLAAGAGGTAVVCQVVAGLGGVGKTQLAAHLAEQLWREDRLDLLVWVTATSRTGILSTYALAAGEATGADDPGPEQAAARLLSWLATTGRRWLVVLDDLTDPADLTGLWPPDTRSGRTVVTTRRRDAALVAGRRLIDVGVFTPGQAVDYLTRLLGDDPDRLDQAGDLAADLGHLPLALAQAAAYLVDQDLSCAGYRDRLTRLPLTRLRPDVLPDQQSLPVARAWALSVRAADAATGGLATVVLRLAALLDPNGIPAELFTTPTALGHQRQRLGQDVDSGTVHDALRTLHRLGLADLARGELRVHALVQRVTRESTADQDTHGLALTAADALLDLWPDVERDPATSRLGRQLRANTAALAGATGALLWRTADGGQDAHLVLFRAASSLGENGLVAEARDNYIRLYAATSGLFGADHPDTHSALGHLARWQGEAGDPAGAVATLEQLLADRLRVLGPHDPGTLTTRHNLARWRGEAGDPAGAAAALEQLLADQSPTLGADHPDSLVTRANLAGYRGRAGDPGGAAAALELLAGDSLRVLGPDHAVTGSVRQVLAHWHGESGDPAGAAAALQQLLTDRLRLLGPDHPDTLTARNDLARWRGEAGDPAGAAAAFEQLLADMLRVLGPHHPDALIARNNLAYYRGESGDPAGAAAALGRLLTDSLVVLGPDHPDTLTTRGNLAQWQGEAGDPAGAAAALEELLADMLRVLGPGHPATETTRVNLGHWRRRTRR